MQSNSSINFHAPLASNRIAAIDVDDCFSNDSFAADNFDPFGGDIAIVDAANGAKLNILDDTNIDHSDGSKAVSKKAGNRFGKSNILWTLSKVEFFIKTIASENVLEKSAISTADKCSIVQKLLQADPLFAGDVVPGGPALLKKARSLLTTWKVDNGFGPEGQASNQR